MTLKHNPHEYVWFDDHWKKVDENSSHLVTIVAAVERNIMRQLSPYSNGLAKEIFSESMVNHTLKHLCNGRWYARVSVKLAIKSLIHKKMIVSTGSNCMIVRKGAPLDDPI